MPEASIISKKETQVAKSERTACFHCGEDCPDNAFVVDEKSFCCRGCLSVYQLLNEAGLCNYYNLNEHAGANKRKPVATDKFFFLESNEVQKQLISFREDHRAYVTFYIPAIHCSSCIYLLENFQKVCAGVIRSDIQFLKKEVTIIYDEQMVSLRQVAETLDSIGYEPYISYGQKEKTKKPSANRALIYRLGVAGFCFGNIMLFSIPEYFSGGAAREPYLQNIFRYLNVLFSLPVFFYSASPFFISAWKGIKQKYLNVDVPVALAIGATFIRSLTDVFIHDGGGFFDVMSGIVFFMLAGRVLQERSQKFLNFDRDYSDYFPMAVIVLKDGKQEPTLLSAVKEEDILLIHNNELAPADGILIRGKCLIDYSFVTGESAPVEKKPGDLIYAGGRQLAGSMELRVVKETAGSRLVELWSKDLENSHRQKLDNRNSFVHLLARNFTLIVLGIAAIAATYWWANDTTKIWPAITAILIIACPCGLLLTATFTNGHALRILSKNGMFLRNSNFIERIANITKIVFDKTGTLTSSSDIVAAYGSGTFDNDVAEEIASAVRPSLHAFKKPVLLLLQKEGRYEAKSFNEFAGLGLETIVNNKHYRIGTAAFFEMPERRTEEGTPIFIYRNGVQLGHLILTQNMRSGLSAMFGRLNKRISFLLFSGDLPYQREMFSKIFDENVFFKLSPHQKLEKITALQKTGASVAMVGDGLNDAGALQKSDVGICITDDIHRFTPAGDAILLGEKLEMLDRLIDFCRSSQNTIRWCFGISVMYNLTGLFFAVQGIMSPLLAAILMPLSTLTIVVTTFVFTKVAAKRHQLSLQ